METLQPINTLSLFETTKLERQEFVIRVVESLDNVDPLLVHFQVKCMEDIIKQMTSNTVYRDAVLQAAEKYNAKTFEFKSAKIEIKETGSKYDFSQCNDAALTTMYDKQTELSDAIKKRETLLKSVPPKGMVITDEDTGETYTVYPPSKSSTTSVAVTLK